MAGGVNGDETTVHLVDYRPGMDVVVLDPVEPGVVPAYCTHGRAGCVVCGDWCWLGSNTGPAVVAGQVAPLCMPCARRFIPPHVTAAKNLGDHRRADGSHD